ncbi:MAG: hypothetical protein AAB513_02345 [Patescibacteria group bacterium]
MIDNDPIKKVEKLTQKVNDYMELQSKGVLSRYPLLFSLLATFGFVSVLYGFERLIDEIPFLNERPFLILFVGFVILIFTGSLYKHFRKEEGIK